ncbi:hypothetical protein BGX23_008507 [Mortierella sp. AD031]|nr:hypothetical protein BGX23_008507 [Mortierella sp. AD031]
MSPRTYHRHIDQKYIRKPGPRYPLRSPPPSKPKRAIIEGHNAGSSLGGPWNPSEIYQALARDPICIHLSFAAYMITSLMLAYNGIMSVLVFQASRAPDGNY